VKTYEYRGLDGAGKSCAGLVEAGGIKEAREKLAARDILAERLAPAGRPARVGAEMRAVVYRELSALLRAGMPMVKALGVLMNLPELRRIAPFVAGIRDRVQEGSGLAVALANASGSVRPFEEAIIYAGERAGSLSESLDNLAALIEQSERVGQKARNALIYPALVFALGLVVAGVMMGVLLPRAEDILAQVHGTIPGITAVMVGVGRWFARWSGAAAAAIAAAAAWFASRIRRDPALRLRVDRGLFGLPLFGRGYSLVAGIIFARTLAVLARSGVGLVEALAVAGRATGSAWLQSMAEEQSEAVRHGLSLSEAVRRMGPLSETLPGWLQIAEESGEMGRLLDQAADRMQERWERLSSRALGILEPALILVIGAFVLLVTLAVLLPILSLSRGLAGQP
jgi:general secretion pathway protein F